ncbi:MAG: mechanosensitive ion channel family protein [Clostridia bacterium]|nr:mechanosensitive ion channel family protein [Clostridia bacterium]
MDFQAILNTLVSGCINIAWKLLLSLLVFIVGRLLIKLLLKIFPNGDRHNHLDKTVKAFLNSFIKIALYAVLAVTIVSIMGIPMASVVTVFASAGAAIALAVQGSFSNFMGGIMLLIFKPIGVGDFVKIGGESGTVTEVGIFYTVLCTGDNLVVSIPNKTMTDTTIVNYSRKDTRRVDIAVGVAYDSDVELVKKTILEVIEANEKALNDPAPFVRVTAMQDSALEFTVRVWCNAGDYGSLRSDMFEELNAAFEKAGIVVPFNQLEVSIKK